MKSSPLPWFSRFAKTTIAGLGLVSLVTGLAVSIGLTFSRAAERESIAGTVIAMPVGSILAFAGPSASVPETQGWMLCDGRELPAERYRELHAAIGTAWGGSANGTMFRLPDLRGRFLRGVNSGAPGFWRDPDAGQRMTCAPGGNSGDDVGSVQEDSVGPHYHSLSGVGDATGPGASWVRLYAAKVPDDTAVVMTNTAAVQPGPGTETRPRNVAVNWIIRVR